MAQRSNNFIPPTKEQRNVAIGKMDNIDEDMQLALTIDIDQNFSEIAVPKGEDWLKIYNEPGQTAEQFEKSKKVRPSPSRNIIFIQPIGNYNTPRSPSLELINEFSRVFFPGCITELLSEIQFDSDMKNRVNPITGQMQYYVPSLFAHLKRMKRKRRNIKELFCVGVTMMDIYPDPSWNFVYGEASIEDNIGIYSFSRFDPIFPQVSQNPCTDTEKRLIIRRALTTYIHEVLHLFEFEHCIYYTCLMNGTNHEEEMDRQYLNLCPVCLKKMYLSFGKQTFKIRKMYEDLVELTKRVGLDDETIWYENRLKIFSKNS